MKLERQAKILEIIEIFSIETQEELTQKLRESGFNSTQATVSRDIKELKLIKISMGNGKYKYSVNLYGENVNSISKYKNILIETIKNINISGTLAIVKTYPGMAQASAAAIDAMEWDGIVGSIAGDDTIFIAFLETSSAVRFKGKMYDIIN